MLYFPAFVSLLTYDKSHVRIFSFPQLTPGVELHDYKYQPWSLMSDKRNPSFHLSSSLLSKDQYVMRSFLRHPKKTTSSLLPFVHFLLLSLKLSIKFASGTLSSFK